MKKLIAVFFSLSLIFLNVSVYAQCAMCKSGVTSNLEAGGKTGIGINTGILYLMAFPYILIGGFIAYVYRKQIALKLKQFKS